MKRDNGQNATLLKKTAAPLLLSLSQRTCRAAQWNMVGSISVAVLQFGVGILMSRLLDPADFGLAVFAFTITGVASLLGDLGMSPALIQRQPLTDIHVRVAFTVSIVLGAFLTTMICLFAPFAVYFFRYYELPSILRALSLVFILNGLGSTAHAMLRRRLAFRSIAFIGFFSYAVGYAAVAPTFAILGYGTWAIVFGSITQSAIGAILYMSHVRHPLRLSLSISESRDLLGFGIGTTLSGVANYVALNADNFMVGRFLGAAALGFYSRAYGLMSLSIMYISGVLSTVLFPAFSEIQNDRARFKRGFLACAHVSSLVIAPVMAGIIISAPHLITGLYGEKWAGCIFPLQILCMAGLFRGGYHLSGSATRAGGRVYAELMCQIIYAALVVTGTLAGRRFGIDGVALGVAAAITCMYFATAVLALRIVGATWTEYVRAQWHGIRLAVLVAVTACLTRAALEQAGLHGLYPAFFLILACFLSFAAGLLLLPKSMETNMLIEKIKEFFYEETAAKRKEDQQP